MMTSFGTRPSYVLIRKKFTNYTIRMPSTSLWSACGFCKWCSLYFNRYVLYFMTSSSRSLVFVLYNVEWRFKIVGGKGTTTSALWTQLLVIIRFYETTPTRHSKTCTSTLPSSTTSSRYCFLTTLRECFLPTNSF